MSKPSLYWASDSGCGSDDRVAVAFCVTAVSADSRESRVAIGSVDYKVVYYDILASNNAAAATAANIAATAQAKAPTADSFPTEGTLMGKEAQPESEEGQADERQEHEIAALLEHRMIGDGTGTVELLVHWVGEVAKDATWESEDEIQRGAEDALYTYWSTQGGRQNALFIIPKNPPPERYHMFRILGHERKSGGAFLFRVQWIGHPNTRGETSIEAETKLRNVALELLDRYWESVGGRDSHVVKRGRNKKARTK
ncbi:Uu.00g136980.m01.CDS01 [Anthostomella pinea]|uniref:Uu.00g136980.m01.CDS01 n=1 Tax=Anthostomella pinea TaxID=933095 RepID=A0AAI8YKY0_9PEZI|nr:Uu.00g136980.m01.CDS01 [Anthostomella pinea]